MTNLCNEDAVVLYEVEELSSTYHVDELYVSKRLRD
jgi:hypothetical protein